MLRCCGRYVLQHDAFSSILYSRVLWTLHSMNNLDYQEARCHGLCDATGGQNNEQ